MITTGDSMPASIRLIIASFMFCFFSSFNASAAINDFWKALEGRNTGAPCTYEDYDLMRRALDNKNVRLEETQPGAARRFSQVLSQELGPRCINIEMEDAVQSDPDIVFTAYRIATGSVRFDVIVIFSDVDGKVIAIAISEGHTSNVVPFRRR